MKKLIILLSLALSFSSLFAQSSDLDNQLLEACKNNNYEEAKKLIEQGADVNTKGEVEFTPLHLASWNENGFEIARLLIEKGADVNAKDGYGYTPLHRAAQNYDGFEIAKLLIENVADVNTKDKYGSTPLHIAASNEGGFVIAKLLIAKGADVNAKTLDSYSYPGYTPLHFAAQNENGFEITKLLIEKGADVNKKNEYGYTPLFGALDYSDDIEIAKLLIENGADVNAKTEYGSTPLLFVLEDGYRNNLDIAKLLIENGADVNVYDIYENSCLLICLEKQNIHLANLLIENNASVNDRFMLDHNLFSGFTPLHFAVYYSDEVLALKIIQMGANLDVKNGYNETALHMSVRNTFDNEIARLIIENGANLNLTNIEGETALHISARNNNSKIIIDLIDHNTKTDIKNIHGNTALDLAKNYSNKTIELLITNNDYRIFAYYWNTDIDGISKVLKGNPKSSKFQDLNGQTIWHLAVTDNNKPILDFILENSELHNIQNSNGQTILLHSIRVGRTEFAKKLIKKGANLNLADNLGITPYLYAFTKKQNEILEILKRYNADTICVLKPVLKINNLNSPITSVGISPNGKLLITGCENGSLHIWDFLSGKLLKTFDGHRCPVRSLSISPNNFTIVSKAYEYLEEPAEIKVWDILTDSEIMKLDGLEITATSMLFSKDGSSFFYVNQTGELVERSAKDWQVLNIFKTNGLICDFILLKDDFIATINNQEGYYLEVFSKHNPDSIKTRNLGYDRKFRMLGCNQNCDSIILFESLSTFERRFTEDYEELEFRVISTTASICDISLNSIVIKSEENSLISNDDSYPVGRYNISPNGSMLVRFFSDNKIRIHKMHNDSELDGDALLVSFDTRSEANCLTFSSDNNFFVDNLLRVYLINENRVIEDRFEFSNNKRELKNDFSTSKNYSIIIFEELLDESFNRSIREYSPLENEEIFAEKYKLLSKTGETIAFDSTVGKDYGIVHEFDVSQDETLYALATSGIMGHVIYVNDVKSKKTIQTLEGHTKRVLNLKFSLNNKLLLSSSEDKTIKLWDIASGNVLTFIGHKSSVLNAQFMDDTTKIVSVDESGVIIYWDIATQKQLAAIYPVGDSLTVVVTPEGYFDGSPEALKYLYYVQGLDIIPLEAYYEQFYRPNLLQRILRGESIEQSRVDFNKRKPNASVKITEPGNDNSRGARMMHSSEANKLKVKAAFTDNGGGISEVRVYRNDKLVHSEAVGYDKPGTSIDREFNVDLTLGINTITVSVFNNDRTEIADTVKMNFTGTITETPNLYVVAVGINNYENPQYRLNYAVNDAEAFASNLKAGSASLYGKVENYLIVNGDATKDNITKTISQIQAKAKPWDVFVFYYAGHGIAINENGNTQFYLVSADVTNIFSGDQLKAKAISNSELLAFSRDIPSDKQFIVIDACNSGAAANMLSYRSGPEEQRALAVLARSTGTHFLFASTADQLAKEIPQIGHGVFTYAILQAMTGGEGYFKSDAGVSVKDISNYTERKVPDISQTYIPGGVPQYPTAYSYGQDFPLVLASQTPGVKKLKGKYDDYTMQQLEEMKKKAAEEEDYRKAAEIKDEIDKRNNNK